MTPSMFRRRSADVPHPVEIAILRRTYKDLLPATPKMAARTRYRKRPRMESVPKPPSPIPVKPRETNKALLAAKPEMAAGTSQTISEGMELVLKSSYQIKLRSANQLFGLTNFKQCEGKTGSEYLKWVLDFVSKNRHKTFNLKNPAGATLKIGDLDDTIYSGDDYEVNGWEKFYFPEKVSMQVVGVVEGIWWCDQLVLMTCCEDRQVYAYDGEKLHLVASSLQQLSDEGIKYPGSKSYYNGEAFKDMTEEDWDKVNKRLDQEHHELVMSKKTEFLKHLKSIKDNLGKARSSKQNMQSSQNPCRVSNPEPTYRQSGADWDKNSALAP